MQQDEITIRKIRHKNNVDNSTFLEAYRKLLVNSQDLSDDERFYLLKIALLFLNAKDENVERLGYGIVLRYSNQFRDYKPLYDVALTRDYIPITKFIEDSLFKEGVIKESFSSLYLSAYQENFKIDGEISDIYRSRGQMILNRFAATEDNIAVVAPTSYGKSEMLINKVQVNSSKKICVVVPSKALLAQMKRDLLKSDLIKNAFGKVITHPDMFRGDEIAFLAVLTQERLSRLLQKNKDLSLDLVLVDEAHNILEDDERARLLAQVLLILHKRNQSFLVNFFTPFLVNAQNLNITNYNVDIKQKPINESLKIERFYTYNLAKKEMFIYDQFLDKTFFVRNNDFVDDVDFILHYKSPKNIVYLNRPMRAEEVALKMASQDNQIQITSEIQKIIDSIAELIHPEYNLIRCIRSGVVYHHGGIPDVIRLYIEDIYSRYSEFKFIITTSTLLEGVNIPAEKIFLLTPSKGRGAHLSASQFKNLIGRVCRFREIFDKEKGDLRMLEPEIYLMKGNYVPRNFSLKNFLKRKVNARVVIEDSVENPLLENSVNKEKAQEALEYLENMEPETSGLTEVVRPQSDIGRLCFENSVHDFNIIESEARLILNLDTYIKHSAGKINGPRSLIDAIVNIFFKGITLSEKSENIVRLKDREKARRFYEIFIGWRSTGAPYPLMIKSFLGYWEEKVKEGETLVYVGQKWGEETRGGYQALWVNIGEKTEAQRVNLAIAKIKEEQEFIDFNILKYVEILDALELIEADFYDQVRYRTSNKDIICMLKNGFSMELARLLTSTNYSELIQLNLEEDSVHYNQRLIDAMQANNENDILIFEARVNLLED